jgi:hypothetical protein
MFDDIAQGYMMASNGNTASSGNTRHCRTFFDEELLRSTPVCFSLFVICNQPLITTQHKANTLSQCDFFFLRKEYFFFLRDVLRAYFIKRWVEFVTANNKQIMGVLHIGYRGPSVMA